MRVAVIGATGFLGRALVPLLAQAGHDVVALARLALETRADPGARVVDLTEPSTVAPALEGADAVVNLAGGLRQTRRQSFHDVYVRGARHLVDGCRAARVRRLVHVSALGARPTARSAFHRAKWLGEDIVRRSLLDVTVLRPAPVWGPGDDFVRTLGRHLAAWPVALLPGRGAAQLQPVFVGDVARALAGALAQPGTAGAAFDVVGPEALTLAALYDRVMAAVGKRRPKLGVPYVVIEPLAVALGGGRAPITRFTFDQLAIVEEAGLGDPGPAVRAFGLALRRLDEKAIREILSAN